MGHTRIMHAVLPQFSHQAFTKESYGITPRSRLALEIVRLQQALQRECHTKPPPTRDIHVMQFEPPSALPLQ